MLCDLNVPWPVNSYDTKPTTAQINNLKSTIKTLISFKYKQIAINFTIHSTTKVPSDPKLINPIDIPGVFQDLIELDKEVRLLTRITIIIDDPAQSQGIAKVAQHFDIIAVKPTTEKALIMSIGNLEINLLAMELGERLPCYLKHKTVGSAIDKGILFEISYNPLITTDNNNGNDKRLVFLSNVKSLIRASRNQGMVISSGAKSPLEIRNSVDLIQLFKSIGMNPMIGQKGFVEWPLKVILASRLRIKSYKQVIGVVGPNEGISLSENLAEVSASGNTEGNNVNNKTDLKNYIKKRSNEDMGENDDLISRQMKKKKKKMLMKGKN